MAATKNVKLDLYNKIKEVLEAEGTIKHVEHYNRQLQEVRNEKQTQYPRVLVQFSDIAWKHSEPRKNQSNVTQQQKGDIEVSLYIQMKSLKGDSESFAEHMDVVDTVYREMTLVKGDNWTPFQRIKETDDNDNNNVREWVVVFSTGVEELGVSADLTSKSVTVTINKDYVL